MKHYKKNYTRSQPLFNLLSQKKISFEDKSLNFCIMLLADKGLEPGNKPFFMSCEKTMRCTKTGHFIIIKNYHYYYYYIKKFTNFH